MTVGEYNPNHNTAQQGPVPVDGGTRGAPELDRPTVGPVTSATSRLARPAWVMAILPNGFPAGTELRAATCLAIEPTRLLLDVSQSAGLPAGRWVVGVAVNEQWQFVSVEVVHPEKDRGTAVEAVYLVGERDFLHARQTIPHCNPETYRFETSLSAGALHRWAELGVLQPQFYDRVMVCPKCGATPSIRGGCRVCGSAQLTNTTSIHHFNCGHVGLASAFEQEDRLECPHCHAQNLVVGADFEYQTNAFICEDCQWQEESPEFVLQCLACELRFPIHQAVEHELIAHHVNRLDPLAAFPSA